VKLRTQAIMFIDYIRFKKQLIKVDIDINHK